MAPTGSAGPDKSLSGEDRSARAFALSDAALLAQCDVHTYRASGPGGQKRNKTDSAVRLRHRPTGLSAIGVESRSQHENKARALRRLRKAIALSQRSPIDTKDYEPSRILESCISGAGRLCVGQRDSRYMHALSEILDVLAAHRLRLSTTARRLGLTTANLAAFLTRDAQLREQVNRMRVADGLKPLR
jgi:hypothetical protein